MNSDNLDPVEMKTRWVEPVDPRDRELDDRLNHAEVMTEEEMYAAAIPFKVADWPTNGRIMRLCKLTAEEFDHIAGKRAFKRRYGIPNQSGYWNRFTPHVINYLRSFLLKDYVSPAEAKRAKAERARIASEKAALKQSPYAGMTPEEKTAAIKAKMSAGIRAAWARRKEQKGNQ